MLWSSQKKLLLSCPVLFLKAINLLYLIIFADLQQFYFRSFFFTNEAFQIFFSRMLQAAFQNRTFKKFLTLFCLLVESSYGSVFTRMMLVAKCVMNGSAKCNVLRSDYALELFPCELFWSGIRFFGSTGPVQNVFIFVVKMTGDLPRAQVHWELSSFF